MVVNIYVGRVRRGSGVWLSDVLRVENVAKRFGPVTALRDVNLHLRKGEVLGLLGDNGAGKSTLIKIISGFQKPDDGRAVRCAASENELKSRRPRPLARHRLRLPGPGAGQRAVGRSRTCSCAASRCTSPLPFLANRGCARETRTALDEIGINIRG